MVELCKEIVEIYNLREIREYDIALALDMLNDAWENKYDEAILISGDGDFVPLLKYVKSGAVPNEINFHLQKNKSLNFLIF